MQGQVGPVLREGTRSYLSPLPRARAGGQRGRRASAGLSPVCRTRLQSPLSQPANERSGEVGLRPQNPTSPTVINVKEERSGAPALSGGRVVLGAPRSLPAHPQSPVTPRPRLRRFLDSSATRGRLYEGCTSGRRGVLSRGGPASASPVPQTKLARRGGCRARRSKFGGDLPVPLGRPRRSPAGERTCGPASEPFVSSFLKTPDERPQCTLDLRAPAARLL